MIIEWSFTKLTFVGGLKSKMSAVAVQNCFSLAPWNHFKKLAYDICMLVLYEMSIIVLIGNQIATLEIFSFLWLFEKIIKQNLKKIGLTLKVNFVLQISNQKIKIDKRFFL